MMSDIIVRHSSTPEDYSSTMAGIVERWCCGGDGCGGLPEDSTGTIWEIAQAGAYLLAFVRADLA